MSLMMTVTEEKFKVNLLTNPHTLFLAPTNATVERINKYAFNTLFGNENAIQYVINGLHIPMAIYKNMTVIITENRYFLFSHYPFLSNVSMLYLEIKFLSVVNS